jgi:hypothetical protein
LDSIVQYRVCLKTLTASNSLVMGRIGQDRRQKLRIPLGLPTFGGAYVPGGTHQTNT